MILLAPGFDLPERWTKLNEQQGILKWKTAGHKVFTLKSLIAYY